MKCLTPGVMALGDVSINPEELAGKRVLHAGCPSGTHQLIIRGREAITQLDKFWIIKAPEPPQNLRAISTP